MAYTAFSVVFGEQPTAAKWNTLGTNDAHFYAYTGEGTNAVQQYVYSQVGTVSTGTTIIPNDDTIPQNTEGTQFLTRAITPKSASNILRIDINAFGANTVSDSTTTALFQDSTANALAATSQWQQTSGGLFLSRIQHSMIAGTVASTTFNVRIGIASAGTYTFNGASTARRFGGVAASSISITEYRV